MNGHWSVTVERDGENIVTIEDRCLSGRTISDEDEATIRLAARHLISFVGGGGAEAVSRAKTLLDAARIVDKLVAARTERRAHEALIEASEQLRNEAHRARYEP